MNFECGQRKRGKDSCLLYHCIMCLSRKTEDDVPARQYATGGGTLNSLYRIRIRMSAIDTPQCLITGTLNAIFHHQECMAVQFFQILKQFFRHTIRTRTDHQSYYPVYLQRLFIFTFQSFQFCISIGICLEIRQIFHLRIFMGKETFPLLQLGSNRLFRPAIVRVESLVIAICTPPPSLRPIPIRTSKTGI